MDPYRLIIVADFRSPIEAIGIVLAGLPLISDALRYSSVRNDDKELRQEQRRFAQALEMLDSELRSWIIEIIGSIEPSILTATQHRDLTTHTVQGAAFLDKWDMITKLDANRIETALNRFLEGIIPVLDHVETVLIQMVEMPRGGRRELRKFIEKSRDNTFSVAEHLSGIMKLANARLGRKHLLKEIREDINHLKMLNTDPEMDHVATEVSIKSRNSHRSFLDMAEMIRRDSFRLYHIVKDIWKCRCHKPDLAMLRLEPRDNPTDNPTEESDTPRFCLIFTYEFSEGNNSLWGFQETEIDMFGLTWRMLTTEKDKDHRRSDSKATISPIFPYLSALSTISVRYSA